MSVQEYILVSRYPHQYSEDKVRAARDYWHRRAITSDGAYQVVAQIRRTWCLNNLQARIEKAAA